MVEKLRYCSISHQSSSDRKKFLSFLCDHFFVAFSLRRILTWILGTLHYPGFGEISTSVNFFAAFLFLIFLATKKKIPYAGLISKLLVRKFRIPCIHLYLIENSTCVMLPCIVKLSWRAGEGVGWKRKPLTEERKTGRKWENSNLNNRKTIVFVVIACSNPHNDCLEHSVLGKI